MISRSIALSSFISLIAFAFLTSCSSAAAKLPDYGTVPDFEMTDSLGHAFNSSSLQGKVWVADFIYTSCPGACPRMTAEMNKVAHRLTGKNDVRLVSISVDPAHDSPQELNAYAHEFGGPTSQWMFLTGAPQTIHRIAYQTFHTGDVIGKMDHSTKFVVVDKRGEIRGYYDSLDPASIRAMLGDVEALRKG